MPPTRKEQLREIGTRANYLTHLIGLSDNLKPTPEVDRLLELARQQCRNSLSLHDFVRQAWSIIEDAPFVDNPHIAAICDHLEAVSDGTIQNLLINVPPGCSKSLLCSVMWPCWEWTFAPEKRWFCASYDQQLSTRDSVKCRELIKSDWYQHRWGDLVRFVHDQNQKTYYKTSAGGYRLATSIGGHGTGEHPDRIVLDDPHNAMSAESAADRQAVIDWWTLTMSTRGRSRRARRVIIMQRLNELDLAGYVLANEKDWVHICLPMRFETDRMPTTPLGFNDWRTVEGELLCPGLFSEESVQTIEHNLGSYGAAGQLQQRPAPKTGRFFDAHWFSRWTTRGDYTILYPYNTPGQQKVIPIGDTFRFMTVDAAGTIKTHSDYTAICVWCVTRQGDLILLHCRRERMEVPEVRKVVRQLYRDWNVRWAGIEFASQGIGIVQELQREPSLVIKSLSPMTLRDKKQGIGGASDKVARNSVAQIQFENGKIFLPQESSAWLRDVETELLEFRADMSHAHDDIVDNFGYAAIEVRQLCEQGWAGVGGGVAREDLIAL